MKLLARHLGTFCLAVVVTLSAPAVQAADPRFRVDVIGDSSTNTFAAGLNNLGQVVGTRYFDGESGAFLYDGGRVRQLQGLDPLAMVYAINDHGQIAVSDIRVHSYYPGIYFDGQVRDLTPSDTTRRGAGLATGLNAAGHAVGLVGSANPGGFFFDGQATTFLPRPGLGARGFMSPTDISDRDVIVGNAYYSDSTTQAFAFLYARGTVTRIPGLQEGTLPSVFAVNNARQVVGWNYVPGLGQRAVLYSGGVTRDLGLLSGTGPDGNAAAEDINNRGWIVGGVSSETTASAGFLYLDGRMLDLNDLLVPAAAQRFDVSEATRVNDKGQILAMGVAAGSALRYSLLLTPVPETQTWALMLCGLGAVAAVVRRRRPARV
ncbi:hypothetical protein [Azohydromonas lata]|uniref:PEP-CTERM protein-sorting domain-containing protein n=1 Tax=Azohydromonas lata TaxID=45677 RepID=A0ABU5IFX4_9BURK|nr:hypothetical protein [Azohydromonas lata]MDZ5458020.1 hypothetical protein [Azohydromonas lata]